MKPTTIALFCTFSFGFGVIAGTTVSQAPAPILLQPKVVTSPARGALGCPAVWEGRLLTRSVLRESDISEPALVCFFEDATAVIGRAVDSGRGSVSPRRAPTAPTSAAAERTGSKAR
jgi:hypothetical protein